MVQRRLGLGLGMSIGAGVAVQARINGALGERLHDGIAAAVVSFGTGLLVLAVAFACSRTLRDGLGKVRRAVAAGQLRRWQLLGGLCGAAFVASQGLTITALGVTAFTVAVVAGQLLSSLVVDRLGLAPNGHTPVTLRRIGAAALGVFAVALAGVGSSEVSGALSAPTAIAEVPPAVLILVPALAGIGLAWQQAVNGRVGAVGGPFPATGINFAVGLLGLLAVEAVVVAGAGLPSEFPTDPWLYLGGVIGVVFIALAVLVVRWIGVLLLGLTSVAGQLLASVALDVMIPTGAGLSITALIGCALTLIAVVVATGRPGSSSEQHS
ncbi:DMT family transporter [Nocardia cyriacigeorgica]|uniref:DMT family transporter n=1 Tax=Nocardia cyriacigeorgica TaxID=135487 RepID=UPI0013D88F37|nr:DMT family transporter [Nocardia cyriacigeorgica]MBF6437924.1 DMT family transporter [Nocardia cyriacigeorgica]MBF6453473.1 DMT family transporter [Nocardia cyriacigeorgica]MBF6482190.1 DMT family transporter [Nocardia cyriacigeorgica]MBF6550642.1 DMT family transporter [Nocardia cyriacigeorgica]NEW29878.1 DMT family transporter [Nocardia cyriacigeorgica]